VKYGIWSSSVKNNHALDEAYRSGKSKGRPVFLFFTVVNSEQYTGVAQMVSEVDFAKSFNFWWEKTKWTNVFKIKWIFVKDIEYSEFNSISFQDKQVTQHRDGTKFDFETGIKMLSIYENFKAQKSIFDDFCYMDDREEKLRIERDSDLAPADNSKSGESGHYYGNHYRDNHKRRARDRDRDRDYRENDHRSDRGGYTKSSRYNNSNTEYHPKKREGGPRKEHHREEEEDRYEEHTGGIFFQKKQPKQKKIKRKTGAKGETAEEGHEATSSERKQPAEANTNNKTIDIPESDA